MNVEQTIFTWKGRHLVLALFASIKISLQKDENSYLVLTRRKQYNDYSLT